MASDPKAAATEEVPAPLPRPTTSGGTRRPASSYRLVPRLSIAECPSEVFCVRFSTDGKFLAAGCGDGAVRVYALAGKTGKPAYNLNVDSKEELPMTALRFRPSGKSKTRNVLLAVNADGTAQHWHVTSGRRMHTITEPDNQLYAVDYTSEGDKFAAAGKDYAVRVYDEATKTMLCTMTGGFGKASPGHSNRVFSVKFKPDDPNIVVSGGWDNTVQIWDIREQKSVQSFYGPHICGDAIDVHGNTVLTGSWRPDHQLETWDIRTGKRIDDIPWFQSSFRAGTGCQLYAAQFNKDGKFIAAGGSGSNEAKIFDRTANNALVGMIAGLTRGVFTLDWCPVSDTVAVAGGDAAIRIFDVVKS